MSNEIDNVSENNVSTPEVNNVINNETPVEKNSTIKNNLPKIICGIVAVIIVALGGCYYYFNKTDVIVTNLVSKVFDSAKEMIDTNSDFDITKDSLSLSGDLKVSTSIDEFKGLSKDKIGFNFGLDYKKEKLELGANISEGKKDIVNAMIYLLDDTLYLDLKDDYNKIIELGNDYDFSDAFDLEDLKDVEFTNEDIQDLIEGMKDVVINSIEMDKITKSTDTIKVDGKSVKVNKLSYNLNEKNTTKLYRNALKNILKNKDLLKTIAKISDEDVSDIKDGIKDALDEDIDIDAIGKINIYTTQLTNSFVKFEFKADDVTTYILENKKNTEIVIKDEDNKVQLNVNEYSDKKIDVDYSINVEGEKVKGNLTVTNKDVSNKKTEGKIAFSVNYGGEKFKAEMNYKMTIGSKIANINTKKAVSQNEISYSELNKIQTSIMTKLEKSNLYSIIQEGMNAYTGVIEDKTSYTDDDDDYDYDYDYSYDDDEDEDEDEDEDIDLDFDFDLED